MGRLEAYKPTIAMVGLQFVYAGVVLLTRAAFFRGLSPKIFGVYRPAIAALVMAPIAYSPEVFSINRKNSCTPSLGLRCFAWLFVASLIGVTAYQFAYFEGLYLASSTVASAMSNVAPVATFVTAFIAGWEKVDIRSLRSITKILGTAVCGSGAICMGLLKGSKLLNAELETPNSLLFSLGADNWLLGCLLLFASNWYWVILLISQATISEACPDHAYSTAWMCFLASLQSVTATFFVKKNSEAWTLHSFLELASCLYAGIGMAVAFFIQTWCISKRGPLLCVMFTPLCTVIVTIIGGLFLHEEIYIGRKFKINAPNISVAKN